jgi:hypothetical protein
LWPSWWICLKTEKRKALHRPDGYAMLSCLYSTPLLFKTFLDIFLTKYLTNLVKYNIVKNERR